MTTDKIKSRFESYIYYAIDGCWYWIGHTNNHGYGIFTIKHKNLKASRVSYSIYKGDIPDKMNVLHTCDNRSCVNPDHLYIGGQSENMRDMLSRNRWINKLTLEDVAFIRSSNDDYKSLALRFGVKDRTIYKVKTYRSWR